MRNKALDAIELVEQVETGLLIETQENKIALTTYTDNCVNIHIDRKTNFAPHFSYATVAEPQAIDAKLNDGKKELWLKLPNLYIKIDKDPARFSFYNTKKQLLCADDPSFGCSWLGDEVTCYKTLQDGERFIGLGEKTQGLDRRGQAYVNWNTDSFGYNGYSDPLYASIPFYIGMWEGRFYGIFLNSSFKSSFNFGAANHRFSSFTLESGPMNYFFISGKSVAEVIETYTHLTGRMEMPPKWSMGYQQCRYSYYPESEVRSIAQNFRDRKIPLDVLYLDIHYMDKYRVFTWDKERFPNPKQLLKDLRDQGVESVLIFDPGVKVQDDYDVYETGKKADVFVQYPDGTNYSGDVWPGTCHFPDFTNPKTRKWWGKYVKQEIKQGLEGFWCDMNEPAAWGKEIPNLIEFDFEGNPTSHKEAHNVYGMQMARATREAADEATKKRTFHLTRAGFSGVQRYAALWTGDNVSDEDSMLLGARMINSLGLSGVPFSGYDVGGFVGEVGKDLFARWISIAAFAPFFRSHTMINTNSSEPWSFGEKTEEIARNYINLRYRLMPYVYSAFYEASQTGMPIARSLTLYCPEDGNIYGGGTDNHYLFGPSILVCPIKSSQHLSKIYLTKGDWYVLYNDTQYKGGQQIYLETPVEMLPVFIKAGSIIPEQSLTQSTKEKPSKTLNIHFYKGKQNNAFEYYEDDGTSFDYKEGMFYKRTIAFNAKKKELTFEEKEGKYKSHFTKVRLYLHGYSQGNNAKVKCKVNGKKAKLGTEDYQFIQGLSNFDPWEHAPDKTKTIFDLPYVEFAWVNKEIVVNLK